MNLEKVRGNLEATSHQLALRLQKIRRDASHVAEPLSADFAERAQEQENDEVLEGLESSTAWLLEQYQHALQRLDAGHYGTCEDCGYAIDEARLERLPQVTRCRDCAER